MTKFSEHSVRIEGELVEIGKLTERRNRLGAQRSRRPERNWVWQVMQELTIWSFKASTACRSLARVALTAAAPASTSRRAAFIHCPRFLARPLILTRFPESGNISGCIWC